MLVLLLALCCALSGSASADPFVASEPFSSCALAQETYPRLDSNSNRALYISADGGTAVWNNCVYVASEGAWVIQAELAPFPPGKGIWTPMGISADGNTVLGGSGEVWVRTGDTWTEQANLGPAHSGALSADGDTAVLIDRNVPGTLRLFTRTGEAWSEQAEAPPPPPPFERTGERGDGWGWDITVSGDGNTVLVGAPETPASKAESSFHSKPTGAVDVFTRSGETLTEQAALVPKPGKQQSHPHYFGERLALSEDGDTAAIFAPGGVWIFTRSGQTWTQGPVLTPTPKKEAKVLDQAIAMTSDGNTVLLANPGTNKKNGQGHAFLFTRSGETWSQSETLTGFNEAFVSRFAGHVGFGNDLAISGDGSTALIWETTPNGVRILRAWER